MRFRFLYDACNDLVFILINTHIWYKWMHFDIEFIDLVWEHHSSIIYFSSTLSQMIGYSGRILQEP